MRRRTILRQCTAGLATVSAVGLAGCSESDDSGNGGESGNGDSQPTEEPTTSEQMGSVGESTVDGLEIVTIAPAESNDQFTASVTVRNTGEQTTDIFDYGYTLTLYDESGADITGSGSGSGSTTDTEVAPGEQATLNVFQGVDGDPADVASFEVNLTCEGMFVEGVYCE